MCDGGEYLAGTVYGVNPITGEKLNSEEYGGACNLGSVFLHNFVKHPFTKSEYLDKNTLSKAIRTGVRMLDNVIDINKFPSDIYKNYQDAFRTIGFGTTGLADMLAMLGKNYTTQEAINYVDDLYNFITKEVYRASISLAKEKGSFPFLNKEKFIQSNFIKKHCEIDDEWRDIAEEIAGYGIRNAKLISAAPTGCQDPNTIIQTNNGLLRLSELIDENGDEWQDFNNITVMQEDDKSYISDKGYVNGYTHTKKIRLKSGIVMTGTLPHKYRIIRDGEYVWCESQDLRVGDIVPKRIGYYTNHIEPRLKDIEQSVVTNSKLITQPEYMNPKLAFLIGAYYANGSTHHKGIRFNMNVTKIDDYNKIAEYIKEVFDITPTFFTSSSGSGMAVCANNQNLLKWMDANCVIKEKARKTSVPKAIRQSSVESIKAFLDGYFMCDGSHSNNNVYIDTASEQMSIDLAVIMQAIGINTSTRIDTKRTGAKSKNPMYRVYFGVFGSKDFPKDHYRYVSKEWRSNTENVQNILGEEWISDVIIDITDSEGMTLDISVPENNCYLSNGVISHNTLSLTFGNNCSSGIEPIFSLSYERKVKMGGQDESNAQIVEMTDYAYGLYKTMIANGKHVDFDEKDIFVTAMNMTVDEHINMLAKIAFHTDMSVSKTINVPTDYSFEDTKNIYMKCWELGIKGCTIFRPNEIRKGILYTEDSKKEEQKEKIVNIYDTIVPVSRKTIGTTHGKTYCKKTACGTLYITINCDDNDNIVETFVHTSKGGICQANVNAINRMISLNMRSGVKVDEIIDQLRGINCQACAKTISSGIKLDGISCPDIISRTIKEFKESLDGEPATQKPIKVEDTEVKLVEQPQNDNKMSYKAGICPECGAELEAQGGCFVCLECGYSKCE